MLNSKKLIQTVGHRAHLFRVLNIGNY